MKRLLVMGAAALFGGSLLAGVHPVIPRYWDFARPDKPVISVVINEDGDITVFEGNELVGKRFRGCEPVFVE